MISGGSHIVTSISSISNGSICSSSGGSGSRSAASCPAACQCGRRLCPRLGAAGLASPAAAAGGPTRAGGRLSRPCGPAGRPGAGRRAAAAASPLVPLGARRGRSVHGKGQLPRAHAAGLPGRASKRAVAAAAPAAPRAGAAACPAAMAGGAYVRWGVEEWGVEWGGGGCLGCVVLAWLTLAKQTHAGATHRTAPRHAPHPKTAPAGAGDAADLTQGPRSQPPATSGRARLAHFDLATPGAPQPCSRPARPAAAVIHVNTDRSQQTGRPM
jgi:hypothetical protein